MRTLCCVVLLGLGASALAEEAAAPLQEPRIDEVIVPGRAPESLRIEIERLELAVYDRFNALNSNDELDIHCLKQAPTGSNIPLRTCAPNFAIRAESDAAARLLTDGRGGAGNNYSRAEHDMRMQEKGRELTAELQRLARADEQLMRDLMRLDELKQLQSSAEAKRAAR